MNITQKELKQKIAALGEIDKHARNNVVCSLIGHSRIQEFCFGYFTCARCDTQVGDSLGSTYPAAAQAVVVGHDCDKCRENYKTLTWKDKLYAPDPFKEKK